MSPDCRAMNVELPGPRIQPRAREHGYALLAVLAALTIVLVVMTAAVPSYRFELQREQEEEMFWRGQQVAMALIKNTQLRGRYPTKIEDLVQPFETQQGTMRILRPSAMYDPLTPCEPGTSNWRAVRPGDLLIRTFYEAYLAEMTRNPERRLPPPTQELAQLARVAAGGVTGLNAGGAPQGPADSQFASGLKTELGPIYGVVSKSGKQLIRNYFDFQTYDQALFFAGISVSIPGIFNPLVFVPQQQQAAGRTVDPRCPNGGVYFEQDGRSFCGGVMNPGRLCRGPEGQTVPCPEGQK